MICTYKIALDPNAEQERYLGDPLALLGSLELALAEWIRQRDAGEKPSGSAP